MTQLLRRKGEEEVRCLCMPAEDRVTRKEQMSQPFNTGVRDSSLKNEMPVALYKPT